MKARDSLFANRVTSFTLVGAVLFYVIVAVSLDIIRREMNHQAELDTSRYVAGRVSELRNQVRQFARDYNNWSDAYFAAMQGNINFLSDNYGITAVNGDMFDGAIIFSGPIREPLNWTKGGSRKPDRSLLSKAELEAIERAVLQLATGNRQTHDFAFYQDGKLQLASASRLLPDTVEGLNGIDLASAPIGVILRTPLQSEWEGILSTLNLQKLEVKASALDAENSFRMNAPNGEIAAVVTWMPPLPGNRLIVEIAPVLGFIFLGSALLVFYGTGTLRRSAQSLADREAEAFNRARTDVLTGLPNRLAFSEHLSTLRPPVSEVAIILMDLDGFKRVNDLVGHTGGDLVISEVAERLRQLSSPSIFFARIGGDEFVVVASGASDMNLVVKGIVQRIIEASCRPINYNGSSFEISCSYGVAMRAFPNQPLEDLLQCADRAMYQSKRSSGNSVTFFDAEMEGRKSFERRIDLCLRAALLHPEEFYVVYQPIVESSSGKLFRMEALARWNSSELGPISPDVFVPIAEKSGIMGRLGVILIEKIAVDMLQHRDFHVSINVSPLQLMSPNFAVELVEIFSRDGIDVGRVEVELTEGIAVQNLDGVGVQLSRLREKGFSTALDDFGTGFSSIGYLRTMPFDTLKIDRSFVSNLTDASSVEDFVRPIVSLGHSLGKKVTAEGVENMEVAEMLVKAGCDHLQGFFFGRPQSINEILHSSYIGQPVGIGRELEGV